MPKIYSSTMDILRDTLRNTDLKLTHDLSIDYYWDIDIPVIEIRSFETLSIYTVIEIYDIIKDWIKKHYNDLITEFYTNTSKKHLIVDIYRVNSLSEMFLNIKILSTTIDLNNYRFIDNEKISR